MRLCKDAPKWAAHTGPTREGIPPQLPLENSRLAKDLFRSRRLLDKTPVGPPRDGVSSCVARRDGFSAAAVVHRGRVPLCYSSLPTLPVLMALRWGTSLPGRSG